MSNTGKLRACYREELGYRGITVGWAISPQGNVTDSFLVHSSGDGGLDACVLETVKGFTYPTSNMPTRVSQYPFKYGVPPNR